VQDYYEELWQQLPDELVPPAFELRRRFLLSEVRPGDRALDLGCGDGTFTAELAAAGADVLGVDIAEAAIARAHTHHPDQQFRVVPIEGPLPLDDNSFDLVWCSEVIEHVADTARWLSEVRRVMTASARLLLTTPSHGRARLAIKGIEAFSEPLGDHLHLYTRRSLATLLNEFGFRDIKVRAAAGPPLLRRTLLASAMR
jgi:2-polyprenyl-3-methyl-5-hydroxy-6-metoxy-1,4-benzoquinol methylase